MGILQNLFRQPQKQEPSTYTDTCADDAERITKERRLSGALVITVNRVRRNGAEMHVGTYGLQNIDEWDFYMAMHLRAKGYLILPHPHPPT